MRSFSSFQRVLMFILLLALVASACQAPTAQPATAPAVLPDDAAQSLTLTPTPTEIIPTPTAEQPSMPTSGFVLQIPMPMLGVETSRLNPGMLGLLEEAGVSWMRRNGLLWSLVEPNEGERNWAAAAALEADLEALASQGVQVILIVRDTPAWAQKVQGYSCGPIAQEKLEAFSLFMEDAVRRYSAPPFNVHFWELGNEPDVDPALVPSNSIFGCWGDAADPFYGGEYYAEMLKAAYPAIKASDPTATVLLGGLLLDCDPTYPPEGTDCLPARFIEGVLRNGGGDYFDLLSYHGYPPYAGSTILDETYPAWQHRGGVVLGKANYLREIMADYGLDKPLIHTEGSLVCPEWNVAECVPPGEAFYEAQADYLVQMYIRNWAAGIAGTIWYQMDGPGWRYGGLLDDQNQPKPAFDAFQFLIQELGEAAYVGPTPAYPGVAGYAFTDSNRRVWVMWPDRNEPGVVSLPGEAVAVLDLYGNPLIPSGVELVVERPVYIELTP